MLRTFIRRMSSCHRHVPAHGCSVIRIIAGSRIFMRLQEGDVPKESSSERYTMQNDLPSQVAERWSLNVPITIRDLDACRDFTQSVEEQYVDCGQSRTQSEQAALVVLKVIGHRDSRSRDARGNNCTVGTAGDGSYSRHHRPGKVLAKVMIAKRPHKFFLDALSVILSLQYKLQVGRCRPVQVLVVEDAAVAGALSGKNR